MKVSIGRQKALIGMAMICFLTSCGSKGSTSKIHRPEKYHSILHKVCKADTTQSYEVYLPVTYQAGHKLPVLYIFDPHGDGRLGVEHFKEASEYYGYILVGSDNSRNGLATLDHTLEALIADVSSEFTIEGNRQYAAGFSGGGRVASYLASKSGKIKGIITCGAGMSGFNPQTAGAKFDIYAIAGREDFNYDEVMALTQQLANTDWRGVSMAFDGPHAWPPVTVLTHAVLWFELNAMKDDLVPKDEQLITEVSDSFILKVGQFLTAGQFIKAADECRSGIGYLNGLLSTKKLEKKLREIQMQDGYTAEVRNAQQLSSMEQQLKEGYLQSFTTRDLTWWKNELNELTERTSNGKDLASRQMFKRMKAFLGIVCYSYTAKAIAENNDEMTNKCIGIYQTVEPQNPDCFFYKAEILDKKGKHKEAADTLKKAITLGFKDIGKAKETISDEALRMALDQK
jgi:predicted esterase